MTRRAGLWPPVCRWCVTNRNLERVKASVRTPLRCRSFPDAGAERCWLVGPGLRREVWAQVLVPLQPAAPVGVAEITGIESERGLRTDGGHAGQEPAGPEGGFLLTPECQGRPQQGLCRDSLRVNEVFLKFPACTFPIGTPWIARL